MVIQTWGLMLIKLKHIHTLTWKVTQNSKREGSQGQNLRLPRKKFQEGRAANPGENLSRIFKDLQGSSRILKDLHEDLHEHLN